MDVSFPAGLSCISWPSISDGASRQHREPVHCSNMLMVFILHDDLLIAALSSEPCAPQSFFTPQLMTCPLRRKRSFICPPPKRPAPAFVPDPLSLLLLPQMKESLFVAKPTQPAPAVLWIPLALSFLGHAQQPHLTPQCTLPPAHRCHHHPIVSSDSKSSKQLYWRLTQRFYTDDLIYSS